MYAIVRQGNRKYYTSTVFGYFHDVKSQNEYERYLEQIYSPYYIVWNEEKTHLTKVFAMQQNTEYLIPQILIVDENTENWIKDKATNTGCVSFLSREIADRLCNTHETPSEIFEKCLLLENTFSYTPISEIKTEKDIENLVLISGEFHDAHIQTCKLLDDGTLHVHFDGTWGCEIDLWFWDDVSYCIESITSEFCVPYWYESSIFFENGYVYLVNESNMTSAQISDNCCWFKAKHMKYQIIPD